jgi:hypothetical protein
VVPLPDWLLQVGLSLLWLLHTFQGRESGLDVRYFLPLQTAETFLDSQTSQKTLGFVSASLEEALQDTIRAC